MRKQAKNESAVLKREIQRLVREIVIKRDGTCILRHLRHCTDPVIQADHLISRANSATYADIRLIVALCRSCHGGYKKWHKEQYDALVKSILPRERVELWERMQLLSGRPTHMGISDWKAVIAELNQLLKTLTE